MKQLRQERRRLRARVGPGAVVADTTVLITLARIGQLTLLSQLYGQVVIPRAVHRELALDSRRAGVDVLERALAQAWLVVHDAPADARLAELSQVLGEGESQAIALALELRASVLLLDDELARARASELGLPIKRTLEVLLEGKTRGEIASLRAALEACRKTGYCVAAPIAAKLLEAAGE